MWPPGADFSENLCTGVLVVAFPGVFPKSLQYQSDL
jgi:hypothetical protein